MTNEKTRQCGVYEITKKQMAFDLGYSMDKVSILLKYFISKGKIRYNDDTKELALGNWLKYNGSTSPKVQSCINKEFSLVKDTLLIEYVKSIDTHLQEEEEEEKEEEQEEDKPNVFVFKSALVELGIEPKIVSEWLKVRKNKKLTNTETAFNLIKKEIQKSGLTPNECIKIAVEKSWGGIDAEWLEKYKPKPEENFFTKMGIPR